LLEKTQSAVEKTLKGKRIFTMNKDKPSVQVIKLKPVHLEKIWGGTWLKENSNSRQKAKISAKAGLFRRIPAAIAELRIAFIKERL
jgi:hypothetical protein